MYRNRALVDISPDICHNDLKKKSYFIQNKNLLKRIVSNLPGREVINTGIMEVSVRLSSGLAQLVGKPRLRVVIEESATVSDLLDHLRAEFPSLTDSLTTTVAVVSGRHVRLDEPLSDVQEVALLIPISGGFI